MRHHQVRFSIGCGENEITLMRTHEATATLSDILCKDNNTIDKRQQLN